MKILHISQYFSSNMGYQENILPYYQSRLGHDVVIICSNYSDTFALNRINNIGESLENGVKIIRLPIISEFKGRFVLFKNLLEHIEKEEPEYIYHYSATVPSIKDIAKYKQNHPNTFIAVDNHGDLNNSGKNLLWRMFYYNFFWRNYIKKYDKGIDVYFGASPNRCLFLEEELGVCKEKIRLLPIGCDTEQAQISISREDFFKKYSIDSKKFIITHGGKITPEKEVGKILEAFSRIKAQDICLVLFGRISDPKVQRLIEKDARIKYIGWMDRTDTLALLKYSDLGIWHKLHTTLIEDAVAAGLPLILRYNGNTSHLVSNSGMFLYEGSVREIQDKLGYMIRNREVVKAFRQNSKDLLKILSYNNIAQECMDYMKDLSPKLSHRTFMTNEYTDFDYKKLRYIK